MLILNAGKKVVKGILELVHVSPWNLITVSWIIWQYIPQAIDSMLYFFAYHMQYSYILT